MYGYLLFTLPWWLRWKRICLQCWRPGFSLLVGTIPWRREWLPTPVFLPEEFHGHRSLAGYSPWGRKESDTTEWLTLSLSIYLKAFVSCNAPLTKSSHTAFHIGWSMSFSPNSTLFQKPCLRSPHVPAPVRRGCSRGWLPSCHFLLSRAGTIDTFSFWVFSLILVTYLSLASWEKVWR